MTTTALTPNGTLPASTTRPNTIPTPMATKDKQIYAGNPMDNYEFSGNVHRYADEIRREKQMRGIDFIDVDHESIAANAKKYETIVQDAAEMDMQKWLQITLAGFQYQDPMNPKDPGSTAAELAQVSGNVAITNMKKTVDTMHDSMKKSMSLSASQNIGQLVEVQGNKFKHSEGTEVKLGFDLPQTAKKITIAIMDDQNNRVHEMILEDGETIRMNGEDVKIDLTMGRHDIYWHGFKSNGTPAESGQYQFQVRAYDHEDQLIKDPATKQPVNIRKYINGHFDGSVFDDKKGNIAIIDGMEIPFDNIRRFFTSANRIDSESSAIKSAPLPEHPTPQMVAENNPYFSKEANEKWARHQKNFDDMLPKEKSMTEITRDISRILDAYNVDHARTPEEISDIKAKNRAMDALNLS